MYLSLFFQDCLDDVPVVPIPDLSTTPLGGSASSQPSASLNASVLAEYKQQLNTYAEKREYLLTFPSKLPITTANSIKLQATALTQLTQTTDQLTRKSSVCQTQLSLFERVSFYMFIDNGIG